MNRTLDVIGFDIGAGSGRGILGEYDGEKLKIEEFHRFANKPANINGFFHWDILRIYNELLEGMNKYRSAGNRNAASLGIDTWGVDYGLISIKGELIGNPYHYRDNRTNGMMEEAFSAMAKQEIFKRTGVQFAGYNTLYQLMAAKKYNVYSLEQADTMLMIPDLLNYFLTGSKASEYTVSSTTQLINVETRQWDKKIIEKMGLPARIFAQLVQPGTMLGELSWYIKNERRFYETRVIATASHDTAAAVAAIPAQNDKFAFISCGTWSLLGTELDKPIVTDKVYAGNFANEGGMGGKTRFLKNLSGLWIMQECKRFWEMEESISFDGIEEEAAGTEAFKCFIDTDNALFMTPGNMPQKIMLYCKGTGQRLPEGKAEIVRCIFESLALKYRYTIEKLEEILGYDFSEIHIVGGRVRSKLLCSLTSEATGKVVKAGPVEATAIGNLAVQLITLGELKNLEEARTVIRNSFSIETYHTEKSMSWDEAYEAYKKILTENE